MALAPETTELLDQHRSCRHVHPEGQGLCGVHDLQQPSDETGFDGFLERWHQSGVMSSDAGLESFKEAASAEGSKVLWRKLACVFLEDGLDLTPLCRVEEVDSGLVGLSNGFVASLPAEDEEESLS